MKPRTYTLRGLFVVAAVALIILPLVALGGGLVGLALTDTRWQQESGEVIERLESDVAARLADQWPVLPQESERLLAELERLGKPARLALEVRNLEGEVLLASPGIVQGELRQQGFRIDPTTRMLMIRQAGQTVGVARLWLWPAEAVRWLNQTLRLALWAGVLTLVAILLVILRSIGRQILLPLRELQAASGAIARGDLAVAVPESRVRELTALSQSFRAMRDRLRASLEQQQAMERERRQFIAAIGHDLRTPLSSVRAFAEGLRDGLAREPEKACRYAQVILEKTRELEGLVDGLFEYAKLDLPSTRIQVEPVDARQYLTGAAQAFQPKAAARGIHLTATGPDLRIRVDPALFSRALNNLLANALRHTPPGGSVSLTWCSTEHGMARVVVADTGEGIPAGEIALLFSPLHRTDRSRSRRSGGAGLGLAITHRIVAAHGGEITCESTIGEGSCFTIQLPLAGT